jgi:glucose/arabinose dehydrogenase
MDNARVWVYLIFIAIYLISRMRKAKKKPATNQQNPTTASPWEAPRPAQQPTIFQTVVKKLDESRNRQLQSQKKQPPAVENKVVVTTKARRPVAEMAENKPIVAPFNENPAVMLKDYGLDIRKAMIAQIILDRPDF